MKTTSSWFALVSCLFLLACSGTSVDKASASSSGGSIASRDGGVGGRDGGGGTVAGGTMGTGGTSACAAGTAGAPGTVTEYSLPASFPTPYTLFATSDSGVWVVSTGQTVAHVSSSGVSTSYTLGTTGCAPLTFNVDVCSNLVWASSKCNIGGRLSISGTTVSYPMTAVTAGCRVLTRAVDNRFWFIDNNGTKIGVIASPP
jgi:hypothetical protein